MYKSVFTRRAQEIRGGQNVWFLETQERFTEGDRMGMICHFFPNYKEYSIGRSVSCVKKRLNVGLRLYPIDAKLNQTFPENKQHGLGFVCRPEFRLNNFILQNKNKNEGYTKLQGASACVFWFCMKKKSFCSVGKNPLCGNNSKSHLLNKEWISNYRAKICSDSWKAVNI